MMQIELIAIWLAKANLRTRPALVYSVQVENNDPKLKLTYKWSYKIGNVPSEIKPGQYTPQVTIENVNLSLGI